MLAFLKGTIVHKADNWVIIATDSGVGYRVYVTTHRSPDEPVTLFTYHHIREDRSELYGFETSDELALFELLLTVSGVGPKMAQLLVSRLGQETVVDAIAAGDAATFRTVSGVGGKVAEKIILELKNKVHGRNMPSAGENSDLVAALTKLGYKSQEVSYIISEIDPSLEEAEKLKQALRLLAK